MSEQGESLGGRLKTALRKKGMKATELADGVGKTAQLVSHWVNDRRKPTPTDLERIGSILQVSVAWLEGEIPMVKHDREPELPVGVWHFRTAPPDGGRDYGNSNVFATPPDLRTLVRETVQNSVDARAGGRVHMRFRLIELTKGGGESDQFLEAIGWADLQPHVERASKGKARLAARLRSGLQRFRDEDRLFLLRVDDYGTIGLEGDEPSNEAGQEEESSPYTALVRNNLDSSKETTTAGGSFGLGKAVLWNCSDVSTVLFASVIHGDEKRGTRVIGKTELTWHLPEAEPPCAGPGWLGKKDTSGHSVWTKVRALLGALQLDREDLPEGWPKNRVSGTSALIVGFSDPEEEGSPNSQDILHKLKEQVAVNFFPHIKNDKLAVTVEHVLDGKLETSEVVDPDTFVQEHCDALIHNKNDEIMEELQEPGDVTRRAITVRIPATKPGVEGIDPSDELDVQCVLIVRLADDSDDREGRPIKKNRVALVRGRGMVTKFLARDNVVVGARPFDAILLAGEAVGGDQPHLAVEQFLRLSEPPAHDDWTSSPELKAAYKRGTGARLKELMDAITDALRDIVKPPHGEGKEGPEELKRLLQLAVPTPVGPLATLRAPKSQLKDGVWHVKADVHIKDRKKRLRITPRLWIDVESGSAIRLPWQRLEYSNRGNEAKVDESFVVGPNPRAVSFEGISVAEADGVRAAFCRAKMDLIVEEITGNGEG